MGKRKKVFVRRLQGRAVDKPAEQHFDVFHLKADQHPGQQVAARSFQMFQKDGYFVNQVLHQPTLEVGCCMKLRLPIDGVA